MLTLYRQGNLSMCTFTHMHKHVHSIPSCSSSPFFSHSHIHTLTSRRQLISLQSHCRAVKTSLRKINPGKRQTNHTGTRVKRKTKDWGKEDNNNDWNPKRNVNGNWFVLYFSLLKGKEWLVKLDRSSSCKKWNWNEKEAEVPTSGSFTVD